MAAISDKTVINNALAMLGQSRIMSTDDNSARARLATELYDEIRLECFELHQWNFLLRREQLTPSGTAPKFGFSTAFPLPTDFIRLARVPDFRQEWRIEMNNEGTDADPVLVKSILADDEVEIIYVADINDPAKWSPQFRKVFIFKLAEGMALVLTGDNTKQNKMSVAFKDALADARFQDSQQSPSTDRAVGHTWLDARRGGSVFTDSALTNTTSGQ